MSKQRLISEIKEHMKENENLLLLEITQETYEEISKENELYEHFLKMIDLYLD